MAKLERTYNIPLRQKFQRAPKYRRAKRAVTEVKNFLSKHMKSADVKIGGNLNNHIWANGIRNPPHHVKVTAVRDESGTVKVELFGMKFEEKKKQVKEKKTKLQETLEKAGLKKSDEEKAKDAEKKEAKEEKKEEKKPEVKKEEPKAEKPEPKAEKPKEPVKTEKPAEKPKEEKPEAPAKK
jgi:large subunit ribosomal protein L31e